MSDARPARSASRAGDAGRSVHRPLLEERAQRLAQAVDHAGARCDGERDGSSTPRAEPGRVVACGFVRRARRAASARVLSDGREHRGTAQALLLRRRHVTPSGRRRPRSRRGAHGVDQQERVVPRASPAMPRRWGTRWTSRRPRRRASCVHLQGERDGVGLEDAAPPAAPANTSAHSARGRSAEPGTARTHDDDASPRLPSDVIAASAPHGVREPGTRRRCRSGTPAGQGHDSFMIAGTPDRTDRAAGRIARSRAVRPCRPGQRMPGRNRSPNASRGPLEGTWDGSIRWARRRCKHSLTGDVMTIRGGAGGGAQGSWPVPA